ncbi:hypothetical protein CsatB_012398 [Cannabis sativa]|uniref:uncharacterized protein LOC115725264 n=1 Tax=Cannabis sativa TaxID=3483 RepID=UPI0029CA287B|nr:uncharacterized protein LOC115725264 [Cannabis sativa]
MEDPRTVMIFYNGQWVDKTNYTDFEVTGILIPSKCSYNLLAQTICSTLGLDRSKQNIDVQFQIKSGIPPMKITDDNGCRFYEQIRKKDDDETKYPMMVNLSAAIPPENIGSSSINHDYSEHTMQITQPIPTRTEYAQNMADFVINQVENAIETSQQATSQVISDPHVDNIFVGQVFSNKETLQNAVSLYSIRRNQPFKVKRSSKLDYKLVCIDENCKWSFLASKHGKTNMFKIRKIQHSHTCSLDVTSVDHPNATSNLIGSVIRTKFVNPKRDYTPNEIVDDMADDYSVSISYQKAWRAREKAIVDARRCPHESYSEIPRILYMMEKCNPGTITDLVTDENGHFKYLYFAIGASIKGWQHCNPIIVTDGTFLKNQHGGTLLIASAQNANRHIFPLAFAIVDSENDTSWNWFFSKLKESYNEREGQCIISDRHESIAKAANTNFPNLMHGVCCYHLLKNIKTKFKKGGDELRNAFNGASKAYNAAEYEKNMRDLDNIHSGIRDYLVNEVGNSKWTRLYSQNRRYKTMTSNIAESVNAALKEVRELPIATLLECLHSLVQKWYWDNKNRALSTFTYLAQKPEKSLRKERDMSLKYKVETSNLIVYKVHDCTDSYIVNLEKKTCSCQKFEYDEMPCSHAMAVLTKRNLSCYSYCSYYYTKKAFLSTYEDNIFPLADSTTWDIPDHIKDMIVLPPTHKRPAGRPKKQRYKGVLETKTQVKCGSCNQKGHNKRSCKNEPVPKPTRKRKNIST